MSMQTIESFGTVITGYNKDNINALEIPIQQVATTVCSTVKDAIQKNLVEPMSTIWYAQEAVNYFTNVKTRIRNTSDEVTAIFDEFRARVEQSGKNWAEQTGNVTDSPKLKPISTSEKDLELNTSIIKIREDGTGNVRIDEEAALAVADKLPSVLASIKEELQAEIGKLDAQTAFLGHGQANAIQDCFSRVVNSINNVFDYLTTGDDSVQSQIKAFVQKYRDVSEATKTSYSE